MNTDRCLNDRGFTLIEMMIVVATIGILAAIAIPSYNGYIQTSKEKAFTHNLDEAIRFTQNEISRRASDPMVSVTASALITSLNNSGGQNPCQSGASGYVEFSALPADARCFVTLEDQASPSAIIIKGYDINGALVNTSNGTINIE